MCFLKHPWLCCPKKTIFAVIMLSVLSCFLVCFLAGQLAISCTFPSIWHGRSLAVHIDGGWLTMSIKVLTPDSCGECFILFTILCSHKNMFTIYRARREKPLMKGDGHQGFGWYSDFEIRSLTSIFFENVLSLGKWPIFYHI